MRPKRIGALVFRSEKEGVADEFFSRWQIRSTTFRSAPFAPDRATVAILRLRLFL